MTDLHTDVHPDDTPTSPEAPPAGPSARDTGPRWLIPVLAVLATIAGLTALYASNRMSELPGADSAPIRLGADSTEDPNALRGFRIQPERPAPEFTLTAQDGTPFSLSDARGKTVLLFFGFTTCPDICPTTLMTLAQGLDQMGPAAEDAQIVFVSVDPERDTPEKIGAYVSAFHEGTIGLTGELSDLETIASDYGVRFEKEWAEGADPETDPYTMAHTATVFVIDPFGQLREGFLSPTPDDVAHDVALLLDEGQG